MKNLPPVPLQVSRNPSRRIGRSKWDEAFKRKPRYSPDESIDFELMHIENSTDFIGDNSTVDLQAEVRRAFARRLRNVRRFLTYLVKEMER